MESEYQQAILIVEPDSNILNTIADILKNEPYTITTVTSGKSGLKQIKSAGTPYALIISDLSLPDMASTAFLEESRALSPDSIRFLIAVSSELEILIQAVNQGAVQRFFLKPFESKDFLNAVQSAINLYYSLIENEKLFTLAKQQNTDLYELNCRFLENTKANTKIIVELDTEINRLKKEITHLSSTVQKKKKQAKSLESDSPDPTQILKHIRLDDQSKTVDLFSNSVEALYDMFSEQAERNGFEMPSLSDEQL